MEPQVRLLFSGRNDSESTAQHSIARQCTAQQRCLNASKSGCSHERAQPQQSKICLKAAAFVFLEGSSPRELLRRLDLSRVRERVLELHPPQHVRKAPLVCDIRLKPGRTKKQKQWLPGCNSAPGSGHTRPGVVMGAISTPGRGVALDLGTRFESSPQDFLIFSPQTAFTCEGQPPKKNYLLLAYFEK